MLGYCFAICWLLIDPFWASSWMLFIFWRCLANCWLYRCSRKKHALGKFDAKAFFEAWSTAFDVVFREESEFKVKNGPNLPKDQDFCKIRKNLKIRNFEHFENFPNFSKFSKFLECTFFREHRFPLKNICLRNSGAP